VSQQDERPAAAGDAVLIPAGDIARDPRDGDQPLEYIAATAPSLAAEKLWQAQLQNRAASSPASRSARAPSAERDRALRQDRNALRNDPHAGRANREADPRGIRRRLLGAERRHLRSRPELDLGHRLLVAKFL
jgi:hypothetical protein